MKLTKEQMLALKRLYDRRDCGMSYLAFRRGVQPYVGGDCVLVPWGGMWIGIEKDGYTHS